MATTVVAPRQVHDGFSNAPRLETPGTLLSRPFPVDPENPAIPPVNRNDSGSLGRTVTINYVNGWLIVGGGSAGVRRWFRSQSAGLRHLESDPTRPDANGAGAFSDAGATSLAIPLPASRPDLTIGATVTKQFGNNTYCTSGPNQRLLLRTGNRLPLRFYFLRPLGNRTRRIPKIKM